MGIKNLNKYLLEKCSENAIKQKHMSIFSGKTIVIDTSIYLYKFAEDKALIENMYHMITIFRHYKIIPIFVFDGKPPKEKEELLQKRKMDKKIAEEKYQALKYQLSQSFDAQSELAIEMEKLRKQFIRIHSNDVKEVKQLMDLYGVEYVVAEGEADKVCAKMVIDKRAWACMSDDMDMFVYGCTRIMRNMNLLQHTVVYYNLDNILRELQLPLHDFREIMILSGTDYNLHQKVTLHKSLQYYKEYKQSNSLYITFYEWLSNNHIKNAETLYEIYNMFILEDYSNKPQISTIVENDFTLVKQKKTPNWPKLREFLTCYNFVFI